MAVTFKNDWVDVLEGEFDKPYYAQLRAFLKEEYGSTTIYPTMHDIFNALHYTAYKDVKVVILGQDPYHGPGQAHGLSFSVRPGVPAPPSLVNIYKELKEDLGCPIPSHGYLEAWAKQGVLLLNTVLTVRARQAGSHRGKGWETFTDTVIEHLAMRDQPMVFILWGKNAQSKERLIRKGQANHLILKAPHPSPLSSYRGFFGSKPFSKANAFLQATGSEVVDWTLGDL